MKTLPPDEVIAIGTRKVYLGHQYCVIFDGRSACGTADQISRVSATKAELENLDLYENFYRYEFTGDYQEMVYSHLGAVCLLAVNGSLSCWGLDIFSPPGIAPREIAPEEAVTVASGITKAALSHSQLCVIREEGKLDCTYPRQP